MVDDDAVVNHDVLQQVLRGLKPSIPVYLGDFGEWSYHIRTSKLYRNATSFGGSAVSELMWMTPYACGGSGTVFSMAAVKAMDFLACARRYHLGCYQRSWLEDGGW